MIASMMNLDGLKQSVLVIVIERDNLERMRQADPITLESVNNKGALPPPLYPNDFNVLIAYEEDDVELYKTVRGGNSAEIIRYLERGRKFIKGVDGLQYAFRIPKEGGL